MSATRFTRTPTPSSIGVSRYAPRPTNATPDNLDVNIDNTDSNDESGNKENDKVKAIKDAVKKAVKKATKGKTPTDNKVAKLDFYYGERDKFEV
jgi:hypothetical protein